MGFWSNLFAAEKPGSPKRRRTVSMDAQCDALVESLAQASLARQALAQSQGSRVLPHRPTSYPQSPPTPLSSSGGLYRQEVPYARPISVPNDRPRVHAKTWQAPPSPGYSTPYVPAYQQSPSPRLPRPASEPVMQPLHYSPSPPSSPSSKARPPNEPEGAPNQCRGTTSSGKRCTRIVGGASSASASPARRTATDRQPLTEVNLAHLNRVLSRRGGRRKGRAPASDSGDSAGNDNDELPKFCYQHAKAAIEEPGTFAGRKGTWIRFDDWIPRDLPSETRLQLRYEMARPPTSGDKPGYLYVHEMARTSNSASTMTYLKIGRSVRPVARLSQWKNQCPSRMPIVRGLFPLPAGPNAATLGGALAVNPIPAPFHHRWERLVLIEVSGRAKLVYGDKGKEGKCADCGKQHTELFSVEKGAYELYIIELITRWQRWCSTVL